MTGKTDGFGSGKFSLSPQASETEDKKKGNKGVSELCDELKKIERQIAEQKKLLEKFSGTKLGKAIQAKKNDHSEEGKAPEKYKAGSFIRFGKYEQGGDGKEDIEWLVLDVQDGRALVISKYPLELRAYNEGRSGVTWENCMLRKWLNEDFLHAAFSADERAMIPAVTVVAHPNPESGTNPGNDTQDRVFLLSIYEANKYFHSDHARVCRATPYAVGDGVYGSENNCWWWLRTPGGHQEDVAGIDWNGSINVYGCNAGNSNMAVRPALWMEIKR